MKRTSRQTQDLFRKLYLEGLSTGDFEPVFRELVGETAALSPNAIVRMKSKWESEYRAWCSRKLDECRYAYIWADGVYLGAGVDREKTAPAMRGGGKGGRSEGVAGYWSLAIVESTESLVRCAEELEGSGSECAAIGRWETVRLGLWAALDAVFRDCGSSEVLEPPCAERAGEVAEGAEL